MGGGGGRGTYLCCGWGVPPNPSNPDPTSDPKNAIFYTLFQTILQKSTPNFRYDETRLHELLTETETDNFI